MFTVKIDRLSVQIPDVLFSGEFGPRRYIDTNHARMILDMYEGFMLNKEQISYEISEDRVTMTDSQGKILDAPLDHGPDWFPVAYLMCLDHLQVRL